MTGWNWGEQGHLTGTFDEETQQLYKHPETIWLIDRQFVQNEKNPVISGGWSYTHGVCAYSIRIQL